MDGLARLREITNTSTAALKRSEKSDLAMEEQHRIKAKKVSHDEDFNPAQQATMRALMEQAVGGLRGEFTQLSQACTEALESQNGKLLTQAKLIGELQSTSATKTSVDQLSQACANAIESQNGKLQAQEQAIGGHGEQIKELQAAMSTMQAKMSTMSTATQADGTAYDREQELEAKLKLKIMLRASGDLDTDEEVQQALDASLAVVGRKIETLEGCEGITDTFPTTFNEMPHVGVILTFKKAEQTEHAKRLMVKKTGVKEFKEVLSHNGEPIRVFKVKPLYMKKRNDLLWEVAVEHEAKPNWKTRTVTDASGNVIAKQCRKTWEVTPQ